MQKSELVLAVQVASVSLLGNTAGLLSLAELTRKCLKRNQSGRYGSGVGRSLGLAENQT
jgi:hypothetical protein